MRSKTAGGGPSIDSNATVAPPLLPLEAIANEPLAAPPPAQPPSAQATTNNAAAMNARGVRRQEVGQGAKTVSLIAPCDIVKMH
jgi:hypothetical protein